MGGKAVVLAIFIVGIAAAAAGVVYKYVASRQPLEMWGPAGIQVIQTAPTVELLTLGMEPTPSEEGLKLGEQALHVRSRRDISKAQGLIHHRHFLTERISYADRPAVAKKLRNWQYAVRFHDEKKGEVVVLFELQQKLLGNLAAGREVRMSEKIAENWQRFITRQLATEKASL